MHSLRNVGVPASMMGRTGGGIERVDIGLADGRIASIEPAAKGDDPGRDGGLVLPAFADIHTHIDKGHIWPRKPNPDGTWDSALRAVLDDQDKSWSIEDTRRRMDFALRCAYAHGTAAIRTHIDSDHAHHDEGWELFSEMRERWQGRIELQAVSLVGPDTLVDPARLHAIATLVKSHRGLLGGSVHVFDRSREALRNVVDKAGELGLELDLHIDETGDPSAHALEHLAAAVIETGYDRPVLAGHCCVLTVQDDATQKRTIEAVARAGRISIVSLPMCNLYLQDRTATGGVTPMRRGVTLLHEFRAAGVRVAIASDNTRDPFYAYGDLDMLEVLRESARILHFDHPMEGAWDWARTAMSGAAAIAGFAHRAEIAVGARADLVLFRARSWTELFARPQADRVVLRDGVVIDTTLPDYRELDDLMEIR
jgi:cytosine deaminase